MRRFSLASMASVMLLGLLSGSASADTYIPIDISGVSNGRLQGRHPLYPSGTGVLLGDVPFDIPETGPNTWFAAHAADGGPDVVSVTVPIGLDGVTGIYTLINTLWGVSGSPALARLRFDFDDGTTYFKFLIGDVDIRDYYANFYTNTLNNTTSVRVFFTDVDGPFGPNRYRLDRQFIDLSAYQGKTLVSMTLVDRGDENVQRTFLSGVTAVQSLTAVPEPPTLALATPALLALFLLRRRA